MSPKFACSIVETGDVWNSRASLSHAKMTTGAAKLEKHLDKKISEALARKQQKELEKQSSAQIRIIIESGLPIPAYGATKYDAEDLKGLIGEILILEYLLVTRIGTPFYCKWQETGTSKSQGIDLIITAKNVLLVYECKHPHNQIKASRDSSKVIASILDEAFINNSDEFTIVRLARLWRRLQKEKRLLAGIHQSTKKVEQCLNLVSDCVRNKSHTTNTVLVIDNKTMSGFTLKQLEPLIHFDKFPSFISKITGTVLASNGLAKMTQKMYGKHGDGRSVL
jgi:hypothetical protein